MDSPSLSTKYVPGVAHTWEPLQSQKVSIALPPVLWGFSIRVLTKKEKKKKKKKEKGKKKTFCDIFCPCSLIPQL